MTLLVRPKIYEGFGKTAQPLYKLPNESKKLSLNEAWKTLYGPLLCIAAILTETQQNVQRLIAYASKTLNKGNGITPQTTRNYMQLYIRRNIYGTICWNKNP